MLHNFVSKACASIVEHKFPNIQNDEAVKIYQTFNEPIGALAAVVTGCSLVVLGFELFLSDKSGRDGENILRIMVILTFSAVVAPVVGLALGHVLSKKLAEYVLANKSLPQLDMSFRKVLRLI